MRPSIRRLSTAAVMTVLVAGCASTPQPDPPELDFSAGAPPPPAIDVSLVETGRDLYMQYCAACHGADLRGAANWKTPNADGSYPPPPHDSSGHTWHHSDGTLIDLILNGSGFEESRMPAFAGQLDEEDVRAILEYLKSEWGESERRYQWENTWRESQG